MADTLNVGLGAYLITTGDATNPGDSAAAFLAGTGPWTVSIDGVVYADLDIGLFLATGIDPSKTSTIKIGVEGEVGGGNDAIQANGVVSITNAGLIAANTGDAIELNGAGKNSIANTGIIGSDSGLSAV